MYIMTLNARQHTLHFKLFSWPARTVLIDGNVAGIGGETGTLSGRNCEGKLFAESVCTFNHKAALRGIEDYLTAAGYPVERIAAIGHRVVHGGEAMTRPVEVDAAVIDSIHAVENLAPSYNSANLAGIFAARAIFPASRQIATFDTSFHQTMPRHACIYPLPYEWYEKNGIRRYGFHGTAHLFLARRAALLLGKEYAQCNLVTVFCGGGISLCAIRNGRSIDTSMGLTPLEGPLMSTRCGDIDPGITLFMMDHEQHTPQEMIDILNSKSGVAGVTGRYYTHRQVVAHAAAGDERCQLALQMEQYRLKKLIGAYLAALNVRADAIVFNCGDSGDWLRIAEGTRGLEQFGVAAADEEARGGFLRGEELFLNAAGGVRLLALPTDEDLIYAEDAAALFSGVSPDPLTYDYSAFCATNSVPDPASSLSL